MTSILLVEDDSDYAALVLDVLEGLEHKVDLVESGMDALALLRMNAYHLIVTDWGLPDMSGIDLCKQFRQAGGGTPILMLTGRGAIDDKEAGFDAGADDYLTKPCHPKELAARIKALLRRTAVDEPGQGLPVSPLSGDAKSLLGAALADKYEIEMTVGQGATGVVLKARHRLLDKPVAIKLMHPHLVADPKSSVRFWQEAKALSSLSHPQIVNVYDFGLSPGGQLYTIVDFLEGQSLQVLLALEKQLKVERAVEIFLAMADALAYLHRKGIVHRDVKPANIMLVKDADGNDVPYIIDFGLVKSLTTEGTESQSLTQFGEIVGSPLYMSPEQCSGQSLDHRSDIFAFGCVMYETLTGTAPLAGATAHETINLRLQASAQPMSELRPDLRIPIALDNIVLRALAKHPIDRFQTMDEIISNLELFRRSSSLY